MKKKIFLIAVFILILSEFVGFVSVPAYKG